jgi:4-amino-4-deoxy-L-arabinose transferase-like glycosyltransferase
LAINWHFFTCSLLALCSFELDEGLALHPDERNIAAAIAQLNWPQNTDPEFYAYNGFPLFLADITSQLISRITQDTNWQTAYGKINLITRVYSAFYSLISVLFIYLISKKVFKKKIALLITFLATSTVTFIQHAHFGVTESLLVLQLLMLNWLSIKLIQTKKKKFVVLLAVVTGISLGTKTSALSFVLIPFLSIIIAQRWRIRTFFSLMGYSVISLLVFYLVSPNTFNNFQQFLAIMQYEQAVASGQQAIFYTMQFINTIPYLFQIKTLMWQTSPILLLTAGWGFYLLIKNAKKYQALWPLIIFSFIYFLYVGSWYAKFNRYLMPVIPALIMLTGVALNQCRRKIFLTLSPPC